MHACILLPLQVMSYYVMSYIMSYIMSYMVHIIWHAQVCHQEGIYSLWHTRATCMESRFMTLAVYVSAHAVASISWHDNLHSWGVCQGQHSDMPICAFVFNISFSCLRLNDDGKPLQSLLCGFKMPVFSSSVLSTTLIVAVLGTASCCWTARMLRSEAFFVCVPSNTIFEGAQGKP